MSFLRNFCSIHKWEPPPNLDGMDSKQTKWALFWIANDLFLEGGTTPDSIFYTAKQRHQWGRAGRIWRTDGTAHAEGVG